MKGNRFDTIPEIEASTKEHLRALTKEDIPELLQKLARPLELLFK